MPTYKIPAIHASPQFSIEQFKAAFFDKPKVKAHMTDKTLKALGRIGALVRRIAYRSIRRASSPEAHSRPGRPPLSHTGLLRENIFFALDRRNRKVVIGAAKLNMKTWDAGMGQGVPVPQLLEHGGIAGVIERGIPEITKDSTAANMKHTGRTLWVRRDLRRTGSRWVVNALRSKLNGGNVSTIGKQAKDGFRSLVAQAGHHRFRTYRIEPRPFMRPALLKTKDKYPDQWLAATNT